mmetsp:Transcript_6496/g.22377  ORF Transcript_6496/g.22377 Transcript_6496/m.22377 type:complete len:272 (+) Transcript_6496:180-995(+)
MSLGRLHSLCLLLLALALGLQLHGGADAVLHSVLHLLQGLRRRLPELLHVHHSLGKPGVLPLHGLDVLFRQLLQLPLLCVGLPLLDLLLPGRVPQAAPRQVAAGVEVVRDLPSLARTTQQRSEASLAAAEAEDDAAAREVAIGLRAEDGLVGHVARARHEALEARGDALAGLEDELEPQAGDLSARDLHAPRAPIEAAHEDLGGGPGTLHLCSSGDELEGASSRQTDCRRRCLRLATLAGPCTLRPPPLSSHWTCCYGYPRTKSGLYGSNL